MNEDKFPKGLSVKRPSENAPSFVKAKVWIKRDELISWLQTQEENINLDLKNSKENKLYFMVDDWKPNQQNNSTNNTPEDDDLPF